MTQELDKNEFYDVYRFFRPSATREEFEQDWDEFQKFKSEWQKKKSVQ